MSFMKEESFMNRSLKILGTSLIVSLLLFCFCQSGWTEERYIVKPGDSLYSISKAFGISIEALKTANGLEGDSIRPKQALSIPSPRAKKVIQVTGKPSSSPSKKPSVETLKRDSEEMDSYVVEKGDTLSSISKKVGLSIEEIKRVNSLHTSALKIGQVLSLPKDQNRLGEEADESRDEVEIAGITQTEVEKGETTASNPLGKWNNPEERSLLVRVVKTFLGVPYKLGGSTLKGIDCSAFVRKIYEIFNIELPRTTREQFSIGKKIGKEQLEEGDLVFFRRHGNSSHVGIYIGDNQFVHASSYNRQVKIDHLDAPYYSKHFLRGVRVKELEREI
jgi:peptidoglycan endopeptidase LytE